MQTIEATQQVKLKRKQFASLAEDVEAGVQKWISRSTTPPTEQEINERRQYLADRAGVVVLQQQVPNTYRVERKAKSVEISKQAEKLGVTFIHLRDLMMCVEDAYEVDRDVLIELVENRYGNSIFGTSGMARRQEVPDGMKLEVQSNGGVTLAYVLDVGDQNRIFMTFAIARCNPKDVFDCVEGRRISLENFMRDRTLTVPVAHIPLLPINLTMAVLEYLQAFPDHDSAKAPSVHISKDQS